MICQTRKQNSCAWYGSYVKYLSIVTEYIQSCLFAITMYPVLVDYIFWTIQIEYSADVTWVIVYRIKVVCFLVYQPVRKNV